MAEGVMHEHLLQTADDPPQHRHFVLFDPLLRPQRLGVAVHVVAQEGKLGALSQLPPMLLPKPHLVAQQIFRSEEHTSELQSQSNLVCRLLLEKKKNTNSYECITGNKHLNFNSTAGVFLTASNQFRHCAPSKIPVTTVCTRPLHHTPVSTTIVS